MSLDRRAVRRSLRTAPNPTARQRLSRVILRARQTAHLPAYVLGGRLDRPIFIVGAPRSGTSLLTVIVAASPRIRRWPGEGHEIWEADHHPALRGWTSNVLTPDDLTPAQAARIRRSFFLISGVRHRLLDKAPRNVVRIGWVDALFPDARFVFLKRDGRDNVNSLINAWRSPRYRTYRLPEPHRIPGVDPAWWKFVLYPGWRDDLDGPLEVVCARQWSASNELALEAAAGVDPQRWIELSYEDLVERPVEETERLMAFLDLPLEDAVRAKARRLEPINTVTPPERGKWRRENPEEIRSVVPLIRPTMDKLGYALDED
ncbi:MAG: sulfotransferase [Actinomycetota bacterium]